MRKFKKEDIKESRGLLLLKSKTFRGCELEILHPAHVKLSCESDIGLDNQGLAELLSFLKPGISVAISHSDSVTNSNFITLAKESFENLETNIVEITHLGIDTYCLVVSVPLDEEVSDKYYLDTMNYFLETLKDTFINFEDTNSYKKTLPLISKMKELIADKSKRHLVTDLFAPELIDIDLNSNVYHYNLFKAMHLLFTLTLIKDILINNHTGYYKNSSHMIERMKENEKNIIELSKMSNIEYTGEIQRWIDFVEAVPFSKLPLLLMQHFARYNSSDSLDAIYNLFDELKIRYDKSATKEELLNSELPTLPIFNPYI